MLSLLTVEKAQGGRFCLHLRLSKVSRCFPTDWGSYWVSVAYLNSGLTQGGHLGEKVYPFWLTSPFSESELRVKLKCIDHTGKSKVWPKTSTWMQRFRAWEPVVICQWGSTIKVSVELWPWKLAEVTYLLLRHLWGYWLSYFCRVYSLPSDSSPVEVLCCSNIVE